MGDVKPWQVILIVASLLVLGFSVWKFALSGGVDMPDSVLLVDVKTGDLFTLDISGRRAAYYPEVNPDTGEHSLLPVVQDESGSWMISQHSLAVLEDVEGGTPAVLDPSSGRVQVSSDRAKRLP